MPHQNPGRVAAALPGAACARNSFLSFPLKIMQSAGITNLRLGTSSWSSEDWVGVFYPPGTPATNFLGEYAKHFDTVEIDSTYYRSPSPSMVKNWRERTPAGFIFAAKFPRAITHEKILKECAAEVSEFLKAMDLLGEKLGPLLLQFPYFNKKAFARPEDFMARLEPFLAKLPGGHSYAVEVRNKTWISERFLEILRKHKIALALIDHPWVPPIQQLLQKFDLLTADFTYIRFLGDRKGIEEKTGHWDRILVNREREMETWIPEIRRLLERRLRVFAYFNNHYAGYAPGSIALFREVWERTKNQDS
ncbi:MAG TPA: DUF72 domain-containing protein [Terriglobia bacterium]|nr:DUF72 domain-containing protein [Terriglobia bacterium]